MNALDYVYRSIDCNVTPMYPNDVESQYILQAINNTAGT